MSNFNSHSELAGSHAFLSASKYSWINYDIEKLELVYQNTLQTMRGTQLHELAAMLIKMKQKLPDTNQTLNLYVNDCIGFGMTSEQVLFYSYNAFGTADAISFKKSPHSDRMVLRIFDLKTGTTRTSVHQLEIYAALFCLEYGFKPFDIDIIMRIYQNDDVIEFETDYDSITHIIGKIRTLSDHIDKMKAEAFL